MRKFHRLIHSLLLTTTPSFFVPQYGHASQQINLQEIPYANFNLTYDELLCLLRDIEEGRIDNLSEEELEKISNFLIYLAQLGMLPGETAANVNLQNDIAAFFEDEENPYDFARYSDFPYASMLLPALLNGGKDVAARVCKHKDKHKHKHKKHKHKKNIVARVKRFVKEHKRAIIIGVAVLVAVTAIVIAVAAAASATTGAVATAAEAAAASPALIPSDEKKSSSTSAGPIDIPSEMMSAINDQLSSFKEKIAQDQFSQTTDPAFWQQSLSWEENGRVLGSLFAHDSFNALQNQMPYYPGFAQTATGSDQGSYIGHPQIDHTFSTDYTNLFTNPTQELNFNALSHQVRGETALTFGYYNQAVYDFGRAIETNPTNPVPYLERGIAHFGLGQYEHSLKDYQQFTQTQNTNPFSVSEFSLGVAKGLPQGIYESGEGMLLFFADFVTHPIQTSAQLVNAATMLVNLVREDQWGMIAEALSPEMRQLVTQWETLSSEQRGELAGYALGKHGTDILAPGVIASIARKSVKCAQELTAIAKTMQIAQETLVLETAAGIGNTAKIAEVVEAGQKVAFLADELGFTAREMGQLKKAGQLETTVKNTFEHLNLPMQESVKLFDEAANKLKPYQGMYMPESQCRDLIHKTGIPTFVRPKGIPENYRVKLSDKPGGMKYVHPTNEGTYVRIMPGKAHSKNPSQQKPYVNQRINGKSLDKYGNIVSNKSEEAHIPLEEFIYREVGNN